MNKKITFKSIMKYVWIVYAVFSIIIVMYLADSLVCKDFLKVSNRFLLNDHWNVTINDTVYENVSLNDFTFDAVNKEDVIVMETTVQNDFEYKQPALCINNKHTTLAMYVDGKLEYEYGYDRYINHKATGSGYLIINFDNAYKGKQLKLEYLVTENNAFSNFEEPWIIEWENALRYILTENRLPLFIGSFLVVLGLVMAVVQIFAIAISKRFWDVFLLALFSICIGLWTLCYYHCMLIFSIPLYSVSLMEYMSLFISPLPLVAYMNSYVKETKRKHTVVMHRIIFLVQFLLTTTAIALHSVDMVHAAEMVKYLHMLFVVHLVFFVYILYLREQNNEKISKYATVGSIIVLFCIVYEVLSYSLPRYTKHDMIQIKGVSSVGLVIFLGILVMNVYQRITNSMMEEHEKELLFKRAYTDELTQLYNRAYCSDHMKKLSENDDSRYTIVNFDLNGLKKMNDTYGHIKGDELICHAARVIEKTFSDAGVVGRMGGDEFIAVVESLESVAIEELLEKFISNIADVNKLNPNLGLSISYGYASNWEAKGESFEKVYQIADERMYAYKQKAKKAL